MVTGTELHWLEAALEVYSIKPKPAAFADIMSATSALWAAAVSSASGTAQICNWPAVLILLSKAAIDCQVSS